MFFIAAMLITHIFNSYLSSNPYIANITVYGMLAFYSLQTEFL